MRDRNDLYTSEQVQMGTNKEREVEETGLRD